MGLTCDRPYAPQHAGKREGKMAHLVKLYEGSKYVMPDDPESRKCIGRVKYTDNLDYWDGRNMTCGSTGRHLGVGKLRDGRFFLCHGTQWQGERDYAEVVSEKEAKQAVMNANDDRLYRELFGEDIPQLD